MRPRKITTAIADKVKEHYALSGSQSITAKRYKISGYTVNQIVRGMWGPNRVKAQVPKDVFDWRLFNTENPLTILDEINRLVPNEEKFAETT